jgi:ATP-dependent DNA helicase Rep
MYQLNPEQQRAVRAITGPCLVLAGAGSGKTRVITEKIAYLLEKQRFEAKHIAAVTFTNKAANEMRERIRKRFKAQNTAHQYKINQLTICTFHALGMLILRAEADAIGLKPRFSIFDANDCLSLIQEQLNAADLPLAQRIQHQISLWKNSGIDPDRAQAQVNSPEEQQAALIYRHYNATLLAYQAIDFDDLIRLPVSLFSQNSHILLKWQNRLRYFLIDEYQDTNVCQYELLKLLAGNSHLRQAAFTAVGDDDQAIYGWRGATLDNLKRLQTDFANLQVIKLEQNYRSTVHILTAANHVIAHNPKLFEKNLWSEHGLGDPISVTCMNDEEHEAESVVFQLSAAKFEKRAQFRDFAILYRNNHQARVFEQILRRERIPYVLSGGQSFFEKAEIKDICAYLRLIANEEDDPAFVRAITTPRRGIGAATLSALGIFAGQYKLSLFSSCDLAALEEKVGARALETLRAFCAALHKLRDQAHTLSAEFVINELIKQIGYESYLYDTFDARQAQSKWQNVTDFLSWLKQRGTKEDELAHAGFDNADGLADTGKNLFELIQSVTLLSRLENREHDPDAVRLSTLHAAKGLEYPHVFLVGIEEKMLPSQRPEQADEEVNIEEERRLMYVGITRAQRSLKISWCKRRRRGGEQQVCEPSRFIAEMNLETKDSPAPSQQETPQARLDKLKLLLQRPTPTSKV